MLRNACGPMACKPIEVLLTLWTFAPRFFSRLLIFWFKVNAIKNTGRERKVKSWDEEERKHRNEERDTLPCFCSLFLSLSLSVALLRCKQLVTFGWGEVCGPCSGALVALGAPFFLCSIFCTSLSSLREHGTNGQHKDMVTLAKTTKKQNNKRHSLHNRTCPCPPIGQFNWPNVPLCHGGETRTLHKDKHSKNCTLSNVQCPWCCSPFLFCACVLCLLHDSTHSIRV